jgi:beta-glucosidase
VKNTGGVAGDEVAQVYLDAPTERPAGIQFAPRTLAGFERVTLGAGESREVKIHVAPRALESWSTAEGKWVRFGTREVEVGASSRDLRMRVGVQ